jgi:hypothetical protein
MPRRPRPRAEIISRTIRVDAVETSVNARIDKRRGEDPRLDCVASLSLRGRMLEPIGDVLACRVQVSPDDRQGPPTGGPPTIGAIIQVRPDVVAVIRIPPPLFNQAWVMATAGQIRSCDLAFTKLVRGMATVVSMYVSSEHEEGEDSTPGDLPAVSP